MIRVKDNGQGLGLRNKVKAEVYGLGLRIGLKNCG